MYYTQIQCNAKPIELHILETDVTGEK